MKIGVLIPTLGDRSDFLKFCLSRLKNQTKKADEIALINYKNISGLVDISQRYKVGIKYLIEKGCDLIIFWEDDDYYPLTYIEETVRLWLKHGKPVIFGCKNTVYYHCPSRQYLTTSPMHSSAYCTSVSKYIKYDVCGDNEAYYDVNLWRKNKGIQVKYNKMPIGIKHGEGKCGGSGHRPRAGYYRNSDRSLTYLKENTDEEAFEFYVNKFYKDKKQEVVNIITRTHERSDMFFKCKHSIDSQTYNNINHIIGSDSACRYYPRAIRLNKQVVSGIQPSKTYAAPYNLHLNELAKYVKRGWVMYLDDDDMMYSNSAIDEIMSHADSEDLLILWRVDINGKIVPKEGNMNRIVCGDISGIGFMFHSKYLPVDWGCWSLGDYRVITSLAKKLKTKWINKVFTKTQGFPRRGR